MEAPKITPIETFEFGGWSYGREKDADKLAKATLIADADWSEAYEVDRAQIYKDEDGTFIYATASGCSCWDGDWQAERYATLEDLARAMKQVDRTYNVSFREEDRLLGLAYTALATGVVGRFEGSRY